MHLPPASLDTAEEVSSSAEEGIAWKTQNCVPGLQLLSLLLRSPVASGSRPGEWVEQSYLHLSVPNLLPLLEMMVKVGGDRPQV